MYASETAGNLPHRMTDRWSAIQSLKTFQALTCLQNHIGTFGSHQVGGDAYLLSGSFPPPQTSWKTGILEREEM